MVGESSLEGSMSAFDLLKEVGDAMEATAEDTRIRLSISEAICRELRLVLHTKFAWSAEAVDEALLQLAGCTELVRPTETLDVITEDPEDNRVLE